MDTIDKTEKELQAMPRDQQFLELVRRKLRKVTKKMQRITALEQSLKTSKTESNNDQKQLLASKEMTLYLQKELSELQNQMLKIIGDKKESTTEDASAASTTGETAQKDKKQRKKDNKQKAEATPSENAESKVDTGDNNTSQSTSSDSTNQTTQADQSSTSVESTTTPAQTNQVGSQQATTDQVQDSSKAQRSDRPPKAKKEWELQKDIYVGQFKQNFSAEHEGKYIAVKGGKLYGPYDTQEQRTTETGASLDKKDPTVYLARIGDDNKRQRKPKPEGQDGADRPPRRDGGSGGRGGAPRNGDRQGSNNNGSFSGPKRGGSGNGRGGRGGRGNSNGGSPSQGRPQQQQVNQAATGL